MNVSRFVEKPALENAKRFVESGYLRNSGSSYSAQAILCNCWSVISLKSTGQWASMSGTADVEASYDKLPNLSIAYGVAEKAKKAAAPVAMDWSDLGELVAEMMHEGKPQSGMNWSRSTAIRC